MLNNNPNYSCALFGCIGNDVNGEKFSKSLAELKIIGLLEKHKKLITSRCGVGINNKERCLFPEVNASPHLSLEFVTSHSVNITL